MIFKKNLILVCISIAFLASCAQEKALVVTEYPHNIDAANEAVKRYSKDSEKYREPVIDFGARCAGFAVILGLGLNVGNYANMVIPILIGLREDEDLALAVSSGTVTDLPPVDVPIKSRSLGSRLLDDCLG